MVINIVPIYESATECLPFHSQEWSISNFPCSLTRNITSHSMENLAFHSLVRWKMVVLEILTTSPVHFSLGSWENLLFTYNVAMHMFNKNFLIHTVHVCSVLLDYLRGTYQCATLSLPKNAPWLDVLLGYKWGVVSQLWCCVIWSVANSSTVSNIDAKQSVTQVRFTTFKIRLYDNRIFTWWCYYFTRTFLTMNCDGWLFVFCFSVWFAVFSILPLFKLVINILLLHVQSSIS